MSIKGSNGVGGSAVAEALKAGEPMPIDIYDAVAWSAITPLSEQSSCHCPLSLLLQYPY